MNSHISQDAVEKKNHGPVHGTTQLSPSWPLSLFTTHQATLHQLFVNLIVCKVQSNKEAKALVHCIIKNSIPDRSILLIIMTSRAQDGNDLAMADVPRPDINDEEKKVGTAAAKATDAPVSAPSSSRPSPARWSRSSWKKPKRSMTAYSECNFIQCASLCSLFLFASCSDDRRADLSFN